MQGPVLVDSIHLPQMDCKQEKEIHSSSVDHAAEAPQAPCVNKKGEFPPPLPSLARKSYNHLPLQVPWILLHANRSNNRVVLHEMKAPQQMLFQPIRKEGRLVLNMLRHDSSDEEAEEDVTPRGTLSTASSADVSSAASSDAP